MSDPTALTSAPRVAAHNKGDARMPEGAMEALSQLARSIAEAWQMARSRLQHGSSCSCCGFQPVMIDPATIAEDIDYVLREKYGRADRQDMLRMLDRHPFKQSEDFLRRISALQTETQPEAVCTIFEEILEILYSITKMKKNRLQVS